MRRRQMGGNYPAFLQQVAFSNCMTHFPDPLGRNWVTNLPYLAVVTTANQKGNKYAWVSKYANFQANLKVDSIHCAGTDHFALLCHGRYHFT